MKKSASLLGILLLFLTMAIPAPVSARPINTFINPGHIVNTLTDGNDGTCDATNCTLREAIYAVNAETHTSSITFNISGTITLLGMLPNYTNTHGVTITGPAGGLILDAHGASHILDVGGGAVLTIKKITFANAISDNPGGAINNSGTLTLDECTFNGNRSNSGGAIYNSSASGSLIVTRSTFKNNIADNAGGAIYHGTGETDIVNSTFVGNTAVYGGAIVNAAGWTIYVTNSTFSGNSASGTLNASIYNSSGAISLRNTIVTNTTVGTNCAGAPIANDGNNIDSGSSCGWGSGNGSFSNTDPHLAPLGNYGGLTQTFALNRNSPAIDGVTYNPTSYPLTDQREAARPIDGNGNGVALSDIGAYEYGLQSFLPLVIR